MNLEELKSKPIVQLTCEEFLFVQDNRQTEKSQKKSELKSTTKKYVYGIMGLAISE